MKLIVKFIECANLLNFLNMCPAFSQCFFVNCAQHFVEAIVNFYVHFEFGAVQTFYLVSLENVAE